MGVMVDTVVPSSAAPALALLDEPEPVLQAHALSSLNTLADSFWPEISGAVDKIQELSENVAFPDKDLASLVAAKVLFHLGELDEALRYALAAGSLFDVDAGTEFSSTLRSRCIDEYISVRVKAAAASTAAASTADRNAAESSSAFAAEAFTTSLQTVVERVLDGCIAKGEVNEAVGVAIEAHRLDKLEQVILEGCSKDAARSAALDYCFDCAQSLVASRQYRTDVLSLISTIHLTHFTPETRNHLAVANCLAFTQNAQGCVDILMDLVSDEKTSGKANEDDLELTALQIAFDIVDNDEPHFAAKVVALLPTVPDASPAPATDTTPAPVDTHAAAAMEDGGDAMETDALLPYAETPVASEAVDPDPVELTKEQMKIGKLRSVLSGKISAALSLDFMCSQNRSDSYLLKKIKQSLDGRSSLCHSALIFSNAVAHGGTAIDTFLRENLDWLARATAWAKFSATSCLGVIHARHTSAALILLSPYLPSSAGPGGPMSASAFSEGGALYALGLIAATGGDGVSMPNSNGGQDDAKDYILEALRNANGSEVVQHGACLGLGLSSMASWDGVGENPIYEELKNVLAAESAVAGEAAGLSAGLLALGSGSERVCNELLEYAHDTQHEKITRGLAMGLALVSYGREDDADSLIEELVGDNDPILRYGGMYAVALAYCGTADNKAIRMLLHSAVSDLSDDVRRAAVIAIGFVLFRHPNQVPKIVALLSESCHAHVRYGAAMAIGIACNGTGLPAAVEILERLTTDPSDFVRQGALIGLALVFMHHAEERSAKAAEVRKLFEATWSAKLEDPVTRFGAVLASGLIDAGGRNGSISLASTTGHRRMSAIVGMAMFTQFWYWFPLVHFIGLSIKPASLIALNKDMKMPKLEVVSDAAPGLFEYTPTGPPEKAKELVRAPTAILSVTAKTQARELRRAAAASKKKTEEEGGEMAAAPMELDAEASASGEKTNGETSSAPAVDDTSSTSKKPKTTFTVLSNPCRVLPGQEKSMRWSFEKGSTKVEQRYMPVKTGAASSSGIVMVRDLRKGAKEELVEMRSLASATQATGSAATEDTSGAVMGDGDDDDDDDGPVVDPPAPFEYADED
jgi:26S proteasome regulatory subunit N2